MPLSKRRKKKGKKVGNGEPKNEMARVERIAAMGEMDSGVSLQDLINVVAYQEHVKLAEDATVSVPDEFPVVVGEGEDKREVGTATRIPGDSDHISIHITDPEVLKSVRMPVENYSIDKEQD